MDILSPDVFNLILPNSFLYRISGAHIPLKVENKTSVKHTNAI